MKKSIIAKIVAIVGTCILLLSALTGCGSNCDGFLEPGMITPGPGSGSKTPSGTSINLSEIKSFDEATAMQGETMAFTMTGTVSDTVDSNDISAVSARTISLPTTTNGETYNAVTETFSVTNTVTGIATFGSSTTLVSPSGYVNKVIYDNGLAGAPASSPTLLPDTAKVGDSGNYLSWNFSDGTVEDVTWKMDPGYNGDGIIVFAFTVRDGQNNITFSEESSYTIKPDGTVSAHSIKLNYITDGITELLSGERIKWPESITVTPDNADMLKARQQHFQATGNNTDRSTQDLTSFVVWSSSDPAVAYISNVGGSNGLATLLEIGSTTITATLGNVSGTATLAVTPPKLVSIAVSPSNPAIFNGTTQQFTAMGMYSDNTPREVTQLVTWTSSDTGVAIISNATGSNGKADTLASGTTTITATSGDIFGSTTLTVSAWTMAKSGTPYDLKSIVWSGTQFVAVGSLGVILTSPDGLAWDPQTSGLTDALADIIWSGTQFVAVGWGNALTSPDGVVWTVRNTGLIGALSGVAWSGTKFVAVGYGGQIITSPDGITWTVQVSANAATNSLYGVTWSGTQYVAVGYGGTLLTSPDGITWTPQTSGSIAVLMSVAWSGTQFAAVGWGMADVILTSPDGVTWTRQTVQLAYGIKPQLFRVTWSGSQFIAAGDRIILTSPDGVTWTEQTWDTTNPLGSSLYGVASFGTRFVAVGSGGTVLISP